MAIFRTEMTEGRLEPVTKAPFLSYLKI